MTMQSPDIAGFRFSTADFGERDRLPIFREQIGRMIVKLDPEPLSGTFHAEANVRELPGLGIGSWACSNLKIARPREQLDGNDDLVLTIITSGNARASQRGRDIELGPGQAVLESSAEVGNMVVPVSPSRFVGLRLPRKALALLVRDPEDMLNRSLPANTEAMRLLALYIRELDDSYQLATPKLRGAVVRHLVDLGRRRKQRSPPACVLSRTQHRRPITSAAGDFRRQCTTTCFTLLPDVAYVQSPVASVRACRSSRA
ncbi:hypothetical protein J2R76_007152 [Bradyrhizobium sp. USDA 4532]|uniref:cupin domain-containing protein n=2 Tax=Bradyrhizobium TaxID=374 RepID=UPI00209D1782|nr:MULTISPECIES: hypothetical protein [unclassified Bradyrhizobium]MCP1830452.1 hypothetical protein [Bradyrhizobium sp. USDA 4545]MCP1923561.1 hypothetical protein [Bradyrhizobium sp. USDA 4532]